MQSCEHCGTGQTMGAGAGPSSEGSAGLGRGRPKGRGEKDSKVDRQHSNLLESCECRCEVSGLHRGGRDPEGSRSGEQLFGHTFRTAQSQCPESATQVGSRAVLGCGGGNQEGNTKGLVKDPGAL